MAQAAGLPQQTRSAPCSGRRLALGSRVQFESSDYREYKCSPSEQFPEYTWCQKTRQEKARQGSANVTYSILHSRDGTVAYVNRFQEPAVFGPNEGDAAIRQYSSKVGEKAQIKRLPPRPGFPAGMLATWGKVVLESLTATASTPWRKEKVPKRVLDRFYWKFCSVGQGRFTDLPYQWRRGFLWVASYDPRGRGTLRFAAIDPSAIHPAPVPTETRTSETQEISWAPNKPRPQNRTRVQMLFLTKLPSRKPNPAQAEAVAAPKSPRQLTAMLSSLRMN